MCKRAKILLFLLAALPAVLAATPAHADNGAGNVSSTYFPVLPFEAAEGAAPQLVPVFSNHSLSGDHTGIRRAVIVIHDVSRDAQAALTMMTALAGGDNATAMIVAPQFMLDTDVSRMPGLQPDQNRIFARWPLDGWVSGGNSIAITPQKGISSFTVIDLLLLYLGDEKFFPDLREITIAGHGAGADFVQRYAATGRAPDILAKDHIEIRFAVANPSSYLYLTATRFMVDPKTGHGRFVTPDAAECPTFNAYPYGTDNLNEYGHHAGLSGIKENYPARNVTYLIGDKVARDPAGDSSADGSCAALMEGPDRAARAINYNTYLTITFGEALRQQFSQVPGAGYDAAAIFGSRCGGAVLFGDGECAQNFPSAGNPQ